MNIRRTSSSSSASCSCVVTGLMILLLVLSSMIVVAEGTATTTFLRICSMRNTRSARLKYNDFTREYVIASSSSSDDEEDDSTVDNATNTTDMTSSSSSDDDVPWKRRGLRLHHEHHVDQMRVSPAIQVPSLNNNDIMERSLLLQKDPSSSDRRRYLEQEYVPEELIVRQCHCTYTHPQLNSEEEAEDNRIQSFCDVSKDTCGVEPSGRVGCYSASSRTALIRNVWPVVILWYAALVVFLFFTEHGKHARQYVLNKLFCCCCSNNNNAMVENYLNGRRQEIAQQQEGGGIVDFWISRRRVAAARRANNASSEHYPQLLTLKTTRYTPPHSISVDNDDDHDDHACTICFATIEEGERVGKLPCHHAFHVDCLKTWLRRRNVCPLCQTPDIAEVQTRRDGNTSSSGGTSTSSAGDSLNGNGEDEDDDRGGEVEDNSIHGSAAAATRPLPQINAEASMNPYDRFLQGRGVLLRR